MLAIDNSKPRQTKTSILLKSEIDGLRKGQMHRIAFLCSHDSTYSNQQKGAQWCEQ
jgi:hypothetical protein